MPSQNKLFLIIPILLFALTILAGICFSQPLADEFGIGHFSVNPDSFSPHQGEVTTINGTVYHLSTEGNLSSPSITVEINDQPSLPVEVKLLSKELLAENSLAQLGEWSFTTTWDGTDERGLIVSPGKYTCTINLDIPGVGQDTKSRTITVNAIE